MPVGIKVWAEDGRQTLDTTDNAGQLIGYEYITGSITRSSPVLVKGRPRWLFLGIGNNTRPTVSFSGTTMKVTGSGIDGWLYYGVY